MKIEFNLVRRKFVWICVPGFFFLAATCPFVAPDALAQSSPRRPAGRAAPVPFTLVDSGQELGSFSSWGVSLADADNDGDLDAFVSNWHPNENEYGQLWVNAGDGSFSESSQQFPAGNTIMTPGDLDADGDVDIWYGGLLATSQAGGQVWLNDGYGRFTRTGQSFLAGENTLGDIDSDGDLDAVVANCSAGVRLYFNNGNAHFIRAPDLSQSCPGNVSLADLDGDSDLDLYVASADNESFVPQPDRVWFNDGDGIFVDSGQQIGEHMGYDIALGDVDGDGDTDALIGNSHQPPDPTNSPQPFKLYLNDGNGFFSDSGQDLGHARHGFVALEDLDNDGDPEAVLFQRDPLTESGANKVLINNGRGRFGNWNIEFGDSATMGGAVGDLDGDGDSDIFSANVSLDRLQPNKVWVNTADR